MNPNQLTLREWRILSLVNEKGDSGISKEACCHEMFGRQTALDLVEEILDDLWTQGLVVNLGQYRQYHYYVTDRGRHVLTHYRKPLPEMKLLA